MPRGYPHIDKYENVDQDEVNWVWDTIHDYQENFLLGWKRILGGEWKGTREPGPVKIGPKVPPVADRLRLKRRVNVEEVKELLGGIADKRFYKLKKKLIADIDAAGFKTIDLGLYVRLASWSHTGGSYGHAMTEVKALCKAMFGYDLPEKIGKISMKTYRYRSSAGLKIIFQRFQAYHEERLG